MKSTLLTPPLQHQAADFWHLFEISTCAVQRFRAQRIALLVERRPLTEILALTRYSRVMAYSLVKRYYARGLESLADGRQTITLPPRLTRVAAYGAHVELNGRHSGQPLVRHDG